ncbi:hypothetical protein DCS_06837 [Drechmeria coniospora]|uniref:ERCC1-like central domain-containing protein n=1 Tax=Drechmeria coniospora TaxID=98403 RepID=A0A151GCQ4_DRECN|nr:hypothetical protein DCS_06837 [Drechmeria coniospora]KYK54876.1 hypothetical protein DCS_06837 [Drechmeria coniospora]ODA75890.1 hypothetical protein RJ55_08531 [Drechmeria coniospora]
MEDDYGADDALLEAMAATVAAPPARPPQQPTPRLMQQPMPQRLDKPPPAHQPASKIVQPTPQALPKRHAASAILVSPRQRGNPVLTSIRSMPWEYSDIPADYVLGLTTCALFLSLKYHRLHPEYIYTRIRNLQGKYNLRILLTMVDIPNHEDALRELSKTSLVNDATVMLCWSAAEAARYIELYKSYENANFAAIRGQQASNYADRLVDFVTVPRSLNKSDAVALVAHFGSLRNAINADAEQLALLAGWGGVKVKRWTSAVEEPFRARKAAKRVPVRSRRAGATVGAASREATMDGSSASTQFRFLADDDDDDDNDDDEEALLAAMQRSKKTSQPEGAPSASGSRSDGAADEELGGGVAAALAKLRENG